MIKFNLTAVLVVILIIASFFIGSLFTKVQFLEKGVSKTTSQPANVNNNAPQGFGNADGVEKLKEEDHVRGDRNARVLLIEYSDLECPFCKSFHSTAQKIVDTYNGQVAWVFRHFPLSFHANAQKEAEATECANELGGNDAFWKYADALFERTTSNGTGFALDKLVPLAKEIGLNENSFKNCLDSGKYTKHVADDIAAGSQAGVTGTPGNILLDTKTGQTKLIPGALPFDQFKTAIDAFLSASY
ncbi:MAG: Periplasmic thiol:disulfide interchange protein DsbA [Candidatus Amesbacteria bacterium GW2011_GWB1_47_26]|uniref:Periplasmic thiol:disulfide interchange protein DsbA n=1 Tax=Candidatus Amesbacteria bacterium GW2011_GWC2_45_19 TaxID=1618366 RepID=A0A0G1PD91_9BACT|nr:MAG: Periplasmic thiol:disulfide interchange protein DsbA [Candidatus Amesbacteria bacterium GW2011_GWC2_45_19]KKU38558.1 MAG: Periplasmic thiol:disulfide interchange protein DsbA [Candidatus Amesbacteria bacterium GW2011_GWA1_46_35]KKU69621.1 MAG: Periplasmic thiol:disulfide interchange protein DsbA [Microgenomates group bacterium GW2011_GWC1_47_20]KKU74612.1 MAG: Periplasmic thiol:disulfide interchange protein DsbA [Candidatus Amesbacteria bacterium GW2011_GWB1_47_26]KKU79592.1 MAG: Peripl